MTTIAFDGKLLVADTLVTCDYARYGFTEKIKTVRIEPIQSKCVIGFTGHISWFQPLIDKLQESYPIAFNKSEINDISYQAIVIFQENIQKPQEYSNYSHYPEQFQSLNNKYAYGSGKEYALGAMEAGANAIEALKIASKYDLKTGADFTIFDVEQWKYL